MAKVDVSNLSLTRALQNYYMSAIKLKTKHSRRCHGGKNGRWPENTCSLRVSLALSKCGKRLPKIDGFKVHSSCPKCGMKKRYMLNKRARMFKKFLKGSIVIKKNGVIKNLNGAFVIKIKDIKNIKEEKKIFNEIIQPHVGILYTDRKKFDHITFWDLGGTVDGSENHIGAEALEVVFWKMSY